MRRPLSLHCLPPPGLALALLLLAPAAQAQPARFDGSWAVTVACPPADDAAGYTLHFPARVTGGALRGENGTPGAPGYLTLSGQIGPDGIGLLSAEGLVGSARVAIGRVPALTPYRYTATARFTADHGIATRTTVRPCTLDFAR